MENIQDALGALLLMGGIVAVVFIVVRYTYLLKKAMIEKGLKPSQTGNKMQYVDIGCIVLGLGVGLIASTIFTTMDLSEDTADLFIWGTILVFGAGGLLLAHWLRKKESGR
ncbi:hypothetical protein GO009_08295 [Muricauda sp. TY007]|uniref:hypothetical protein n=1 Tax=Allomuricauda sp. TY007 TaxID=2683200 RepID=UPI0013C0E6C3|nr:hypothetical protein [Muricauda sp. TY007]NDV16022.1 hypothetical protein [Muricauda sp. TY007]